MEHMCLATSEEVDTGSVVLVVGNCSLSARHLGTEARPPVRRTIPKNEEVGLHNPIAE